jgi:adenine C2-methylase RlmN of 23S rRNA A2503 and tRNA A37
VNERWIAHESKIDESVNFIKQWGHSIYECRYVRREDHQVVVYLSSHNGCNMSCRFCHLTATGQTSMTPVDQWGFDEQAGVVLDYWNKHKRTGGEKLVNFNFMARGEPLQNPRIRNYGHWMQIRRFLWEMSSIYGLTPSYNLSTILPKNGPDLRSYVQDDTKLYWSLYSPLEKFRKRWLPKAMEPLEAADKINYFRDLGGKVVLHNAFIKDQNDTPEQVDELVKFIENNGLTGLDYNIVRYNPYDERYGEESDRVDDIQKKLQTIMKGRVQIVPRVGRDVYASCGTFPART